MISLICIRYACAVNRTYPGYSAALDHSHPSPMSVFQLISTIARPASSSIARSVPSKPPFSQVRPIRKEPRPGVRSEEHTSELQSQSNLVCRLLLEKKKK